MKKNKKNSQKDLKEYKSEYYDLKNKYVKLEKSNEMISEKFTFVSEVLESKPKCVVGLDKFKSILNNDFMEFANLESSLAEEAEAVLIFQSIEKELELIVTFPSIYNKSIVAIGGGFSSGKSSFVNSFISEKYIELPVGITPVTAIPTYIISGDNDIRGFSANGGVISINSSFYKKLSHDFIKSFKFNLKEIMPYIAISTPLESKYLEHICLIDTPGYNPGISNDGYTELDKTTAFEFLEQANALIWMIGLDSTGTFPSSDLKFLSKLDLDNKKLFIVANKADLKSKSELEDILDELEESLDDYDIEYNGISAYSANLIKESMYRKKSLYEFFKEMNNTKKVEKKIITRIDSVHDMYEKSMIDDKNKVKKINSNLNSIELDLIEVAFGSEYSKMQDRMLDIKNSIRIENFENQNALLKLIRKNMKLVINELFEEIF